MKKISLFITIVCLMLSSITLFAQQGDKSKRPSPPANVSETLTSGATISINYSQPSIKGRTIGIDLEPKNGEVWRTGANEATVFETSKTVKIEGQELPAGKYALFTLAGDDEWVIIFSKKWKQWGAYDYKQSDDALRVTVKPGKSTSFIEKMTFTISSKGLVNLMWGDLKVGFEVQ